MNLKEQFNKPYMYTGATTVYLIIIAVLWIIEKELSVYIHIGILITTIITSIYATRISYHREIDRKKLIDVELILDEMKEVTKW